MGSLGGGGNMRAINMPPTGLRFLYIRVFRSETTVRDNKRTREPRPYEEWKMERVEDFRT